MTKMNKIPAGYRVTSVSCENDGDHYQTVMKEGLSENEVKLLGAVVSMMYSGDSRLENNYEPNKKEMDFGHKVYLTVFEQYAHMYTPEQMQEMRTSFQPINDYICKNITGNSVEGYAVRDLQDVTIEYFPEDVLIENVTDQFVK